MFNINIELVIITNYYLKIQLNLRSILLYNVNIKHKQMNIKQN